MALRGRSLETRMATVGVFQILDVRFEEDDEKTWENDWEDRFVLVTGKLPVLRQEVRVVTSKG